MIRWLLPAFVLHGAGVLAAAVLSEQPSARAPSPKNSSVVQAEPSSELGFVDVDWHFEPSEPDPAASLAAFSWSRSVPAEPRSSEGLASKQPAAREGRSEGSAARREVGSHSGGGALVSPPDVAPQSAAGEQTPGPRQTPRLSLDQLGIGAQPAFDVFATPPPSALERAHTRLQASLHQGALEQDRQARLGPEGPIVTAAHRVVTSNDLLLDTSAVVSVLVDKAGRVASIELLEASGQAEGWRRATDDLRKALGTLTLPSRAPTDGWGLKLRLSTALRLPSGADPGLRLDVLGLLSHGGTGPRSASLSLAPSAPPTRERVIDDAGRHMDRPLSFEVGLLKWHGDVSDLAAAQRVVEVAVLAIDGATAP